MINRNKSPLMISAKVAERGGQLLVVIGYGFLLFTIFDYGAVMIPPRFGDPVWEFQTIGQLVERIWAPLLGYVFIYYRQQGEINRLELIMLNLLSWIGLLLGLAFLILIPLLINNSIRIQKINDTQFQNRLSQVLLQLDQGQKNLQQATPKQLQDGLNNLKQQQPNLPDIGIDQFKKQSLEQIELNRQNTRTQIKVAQKQTNRNLLKNTVKWSMGSFISGFLLISIWRFSDWVRIGANKY